MLKKMLVVVLLLGEMLQAQPAPKRMRIVMVTISTPNRQPFFQYALDSFKKYVERWKYSLYVYQTTQDLSRPVSWSKIKVVSDLLKDDIQKFDWVVWIDDDIFITNPNIRLEHFIQKCGPQTNFIIASHKEFSQIYADVNAGAFFVKNTQWSKDFLQRVWDIGNYRYNQETGSSLEQSAISELLGTPEYKESPYIAKLPARTIQSLITFVAKGDMGDYGQWQPGDFAAHLACASTFNRVHIMEQFVKNSNVYPELPVDLRGYYTIKQD